MNPELLDQKLDHLGYGGLARHEPVNGGDTCRAYHLITKTGDSCFLKFSEQAPACMFSAEAIGLKAIARTNTLDVPDVFWFDDQHLLLEYAKSASTSAAYWRHLGTGLAAMHTEPQHCFGFVADNYCGNTRQPNPTRFDGHAFFAESRLLYQGQLAVANGLLPVQQLTKLEGICARLKDIIPEQPASLLHGDLWSGNHLCTQGGTPYLIDPACYWGWAEADIAFTHLFGGFPELFYRAYYASITPEAGWHDRIDLYNLYHILNHLNLFGKRYLARTLQVIQKYA